MATFSSLAEVRDSVGRDLGYSDWILVDQDRVDAFAEATEDRQWIHVDPERAKAGPFGGTIAHGYLTLSLLAPFMGDLLHVEGVRMGVNYGANRVRFPAPVPVGSRLRAHGELAAVQEVNDGGLQLTVLVTVEREGGGKPVCVAEKLVRLYP
jgi:acyl dehydratase